MFWNESRNVMFSGTVPDYLFIYVFLSFPEILCFQALGQIISRSKDWKTSAETEAFHGPWSQIMFSVSW